MKCSSSLRALLALALVGTSLAELQPSLPITENLVLDLNADMGITIEDGQHVSQWNNLAPNAKSEARAFVKRDQGRRVAGSGRPVLKENLATLNGHNTLVFRQGELVNMDEDAFDDLTTGSGFTWFCILAVYEQRVGLKDVNSFFGNLRNGQMYEGLWANLRDDNTLWTGGRNGLTFGRFDKNNPLILGPKLQPNRYYLVASRLSAGTGNQTMELFLNDLKPVATGVFPVNAKANPSRMAVGQERDAIQHPGRESFDGEIARLLIYEGALSEKKLQAVFDFLKKCYGL